MEKYINKILLIIMIICGSFALLLGIRIAINKSFIKNYPDSSQEYKLVLLSMFNYYEPYIALYNYGNYYYKIELFEEAVDKYKQALEYKIPKNKICEVEINLSLALIKQSEGERKKTRVKELLEEAKTHLNRCMNLNIEMPDDDYGIDNKNGVNDSENSKDKDHDKNKEENKGAGSGGGEGNASSDSSGEGNGNGEGDGEGSGSGEGSGNGKADPSSSTDGEGKVDGSGGKGSSGDGEGFGDGTGDSSGKGKGTSQSIGYTGRSVEEQQSEAKKIANEVAKSLDDLFNNHLDEINDKLPSDEEWKELLEEKADAIGAAEMSAAERASQPSKPFDNNTNENKIYTPPGNVNNPPNNNNRGNAGASETPGNGSGEDTSPPEIEISIPH